MTTTRPELDATANRRQATSPTSRIANRAVDRLRRATPLPVTVSIGCTSHDRSQPIAATLARADEALYAAKAAGRNQLMVASRV